MRFLTYNPEQGYLLPPSVRDVLGEDHVCFFLHRAVARLDLGAFAQGYIEEGGPADHPALLLHVWLYAYALGVTSARRLEQRVREDLAFRYLAGGATPDFWTLNQFRTRHARALNDLFTQVVELARSLGMGRLGHVAVDSTRVAANASRARVDTVAKLRAALAKMRRPMRRWQQQCHAPSSAEAAGQQLRQLAPFRLAVQERREGRVIVEVPPNHHRQRLAGPIPYVLDARCLDLRAAHGHLLCSHPSAGEQSLPPSPRRPARRAKLGRRDRQGDGGDPGPGRVNGEKRALSSVRRRTDHLARFRRGDRRGHA